MSINNKRKVCSLTQYPMGVYSSDMIADIEKCMNRRSKIISGFRYNKAKGLIE